MSDGVLEPLVELLRGPRFEGSDLIRTLKRDPALAECFAAPMGGVDGLTLEDHTLNALALYEQHFEGRILALMSPASFKLLLALHDVGKPAAVAMGRPAEQHAGTLRMISDALFGIDWPRADIDKIKVLIDGDPIGACLNSKHHLPLVDAAAMILAGAEHLHVSARHYWDCLIVYYQCDAAAYPSLSSKVFIHDDQGAPLYAPGAGRFLFRESEEASRFDRLESRVLEGDMTIDPG